MWARRRLARFAARDPCKGVQGRRAHGDSARLRCVTAQVCGGVERRTPVPRRARSSAVVCASACLCRFGGGRNVCELRCDSHMLVKCNRRYVSHNLNGREANPALALPHLVASQSAVRNRWPMQPPTEIHGHDIILHSGAPFCQIMQRVVLVQMQESSLLHMGLLSADPRARCRSSAKSPQKNGFPWSLRLPKWDWFALVTQRKRAESCSTRARRDRGPVLCRSFH